MKPAYILTLKAVFEIDEKIVFLNYESAINYFKECIKQAFKENETEKDDNGKTLDQCLQLWEMESDPYTAKLESAYFGEG